MSAPPAGPEPREDSLHVLFVCHSSALGGAEVYLEQIVRRMAREAAVRVVCRPGLALDEWAGRLAGAGAEVLRLDPRGRADFARLRHAIRWASVVHLNLADRHGTYQVAAVLACRLERRPLVCTHHLAREAEDLPMGAIGRRFRTLALRGVYGYARWHIVLSEEAGRLLRTRAGLDPRRTVQVANGVDLERFPPVPADERAALRARLLGSRAEGRVVCITVARLTAQKGLDVLVAAAARLAGASTRFVIVGGGEERGPLERQIAELGVADDVELAGARPPDEVPGWLAAADVFVLPSHYEGLSLAALEAMAARLPLVLTRVSGSAELAPTPEDGRVVPPGDPDALADAIAELAADPELRGRLAARARARAEGFSWDECFARTSALLREVAVAA